MTQGNILIFCFFTGIIAAIVNDILWSM